MNGNIDYWNNVYRSIKHNKITYDLWLDKFKFILENHKNDRVLDLGCGTGSDTLYLSERGYNVIACDYSQEALSIVKENIKGIESVQLDISKRLPFHDNNVGLIIADLSIHYFNEETTFSIMDELKRIMKNNGHLIIRVNSINDINYGAGCGEEIENHFYLTKDGYKRFFDEYDIRYFFNVLKIEYLEEAHMDRYGDIKKTFEVVLKKYKNEV